MGSFTTTMSVLAVRSFWAKSAMESIRAVFGQSLAPHLLLGFLGGFGSICRIVFGQFYLISGSFRAVFIRKMTEWITHSVIVNHCYLGF